MFTMVIYFTLHYLLIKLALAYDMRSLRLSIVDNYEFNCANTYCLPYFNSTEVNVRRCQIRCLADIQCRAAIYYRSMSTCKLFMYQMDPMTNMMMNMNSTALLVIGGTRNPQSEYPFFFFTKDL